MVVKKTAISLDGPLIDEVDALAKEMEVSRSHLFQMAAREFIQRHKDRKLLEAINAAYPGSPDPAEKKLQAQMKSKQRRLVDDQW
jgi:metal-responsive CopG/Arc/MetJ family transcriptional regulator